MNKLASRTSVEPGCIVVRHLYEHFRLYHSRPRGLKDRLFRFERAKFEDFFALQDVSLEVAPGESVAVIGPNGSGKSTLLKCLARILPADRGEVQVRGKVASLLELGAGFHGDLTGRENIFLNGSILGLRRREIEEVFDQIVSFAGIEEFLDTPVRNYSSGMYVRLGFTIATHVDPDVLLIDEILGVGDEAFQVKCFERMYDFKRRGKTIILVTHDLDSAARLCDRALLLEHGRIIAEGAARSVVDAYRERVHNEQSAERGPAGQLAPKGRWGTGEAEIVSVGLFDGNGVSVASIPPGEVCTFGVVVHFKQDVSEPIFGFILRADNGTELFVMNTMWRGITTGNYRSGDSVEVGFRFRTNLLPGKYVLTTAVAHNDAQQWYDWWNDCVEFHVVGFSPDKGIVHVDADVGFEILSLRNGAS